MACKKVLSVDKFKDIIHLFSDWDETLEREEREQEEKDLIEFAAVKELEQQVCFDYPVENENEQKYQQNEIYRYLLKRKKHFSKIL